MARRRFKFTLNEADDRENALIPYLRFLLQDKKFVTTLRRALFLVWSLDQGDTTELEKQYPWITKCNQQPNDEALIQQFRDMLSQHVAQPMPPVEHGMKPLSKANVVQMPIFDDEDTLLLKKDDNAGENSTASFLDAAFGFQKDNKE